jgi:hypothetical protein
LIELKGEIEENISVNTYGTSASRDNMVGIVTSYGLDNRTVGFRVPVGSRILSPPQRLGPIQPSIQRVLGSLS